MNTKQAKQTKSDIKKAQEEFLEERRLTVMADELNARYWKSQVEVMEYSLKYETLLPEYKAYLERAKAEEAKRKEEFAEQLKKNAEAGLTQEADGQPVAEPVIGEYQTQES